MPSQLIVPKNPQIATPANAPSYFGNLSDEIIRKGMDFTLSPLRQLDGSFHPDWLMPGATPTSKPRPDFAAHWEACKAFFWYFASEYVYIKNKASQVVKFKLNDPQLVLEKVIQEEFMRRNKAWLWVLKARQIGSSLYFSIRGLWAALLYNMPATIFAAKKDEQGLRVIFPYVYNALLWMRKYAKQDKFPFPKLLNTDVMQRSNGVMTFADVEINGIEITGRGGVEIKEAEDSAVGFTCPYAHITEAARVRAYGPFSAALTQAIPPEPFASYYINESTAYHTSPFFYDEWVRYDNEYGQWKQGLTAYPGFRAVFVPAWVHKEYRVPQYVMAEYDWDRFHAERDPAVYGEDEDELVAKDWYDPLTDRYIKLDLDWWLFRRNTIRKQTVPSGTPFTQRQIFDQDYPSIPSDAKVSAGKSVFPPELIEKRKSFCIPPIWKGEAYVNPENEQEAIFEERPRGKFLIWDRPRYLRRYILGIDLAGGVFGDYHVGLMWDALSKFLAGAYRSNDEDREDFLVKMMAFGRLFNVALMVPESNYYGQDIAKILTDQGREHYRGAPYPNIFRRSNTQDVPYAPPKQNIGVHTTDVSKNYGHTLILQRLKDFDKFDIQGNLAYRGTHIPYYTIIDEAGTWERKVRDDGSYADSCPSAAQGCHDDTISALMNCFFGEEFLFGNFQDSESEAATKTRPLWSGKFIESSVSGLSIPTMDQKEIDDFINENSYYDEPMFK